MTKSFMQQLEQFKEKYGAVFENKSYQELKEDTEDLAMCINDECKRKLECLRFTETPSKYKYAVRYSKMDGENGCNYFFEPKIK